MYSLFDIRDLERLAAQLLNESSGRTCNTETPKEEPKEEKILKVERNVDENKISFKFIVPGVSKEDIQVWTENGMLYVKAQDDQRCFALDQFNSATKKLNKEPVLVKLALGVLTVEFGFNVDEANKRHDYNIDSVD